MRKLIRNVSIKIPSSNVLRIPGLIRDFKHSNSNLRHWRLTSKGSLFFWDTLYEYRLPQLSSFRAEIGQCVPKKGYPLKSSAVLHVRI